MTTANNNETMEQPKLPPRIFLLVENPKKTNNLGPILRCAAAFGVTQVVMVGIEKRCNTSGAHGAAKHVDQISFPVLDLAVEYLRAPTTEGGCGCSIVGLLNGGVEAFSKTGSDTILMQDGDVDLVSVSGKRDPDGCLKGLPKSYPVHIHPFPKGSNVCLVINKNHKGLLLHLSRVCDSFIHVPILKPGTVDVPSCLSISLHHLTQWAGYRERVFEGHKFQVDIRVQRGRLERFNQNLEMGSQSNQEGVKRSTDSIMDYILVRRLFAEDESEGGDY